MLVVNVSTIDVFPTINVDNLSPLQKCKKAKDLFFTCAMNRIQVPIQLILSTKTTG